MISRQSFFNDVAETWDSRFYTPKLIDFLEQIVPTFRIKQGQKVLDVGTGTGVLISFLLKSVGSTGHITAVDYAQKMAVVCSVKFSQFSNVNVMVEEVENLSFPSQSFDAITCFGLFPHLENKKQALCEMNRVLRPRGRLIIAHALSSAEIASHHHNASSAVADDILPKEQSMRKLLKETGFSGIQITDNPGCYLCLSNKQLNSKIRGKTERKRLYRVHRKSV
jgi:ubiquinone/menaquinone biosynthesis C-methylase UbiE